MKSQVQESANRIDCLHKIRIKTHSGSLSNGRIKSAFKSTFSKEPDAIRSEGRSLVVYTSEELTEKKVKRFADGIGTYVHFKKEKDGYSFML